MLIVMLLQVDSNPLRESKTENEKKLNQQFNLNVFASNEVK